MKQLVQNLKTGKMKIIEVPVPFCSTNRVLVRVYYSLISSGTEAMKVAISRKGYIGKAKEKPDQVKQVISALKRNGFISTYRKIIAKLNAWASLGYSCAGEVIDVGENVLQLRVGDYVACAGQDFANHAEVVSVPVNLCSKIPENISFKEAAYTTLGAIALQGIRQADLRLGESCAVIGLGLLGQLTVQLLKAAGITIFGIDIEKYKVEKAIEGGANFSFVRNEDGLEQKILSETSGYGVDAVIITAGTKSIDPVELAGRLARKKGKVVIVGAVPTGFSRENYYKKELELRMSCSYGPGRYDPNYEEKGVDYPYGYVRWTEKRNMEAFLHLVSEGKVKLDHITTHIFDFDEAFRAYDLILKKSEPYLGILLKYHSKRKVEKNVVLFKEHVTSDIKVGFIGAGSFAQAYLLPYIKRFSDVSLVGIATAKGNSVRTVADRYGFNFCTCDYTEITRNRNINTVFVVTRHNLHTEQVIDALKNEKNVFVEKPLAISIEKLEEVKKVYEKVSKSSEKKPILMVGFNRRFAPFVGRLKKLFRTFPISINYRINAGYIPLDHWIQDLEIGGGRIIGEVCHFVDLVVYLVGSFPIAVSSFVMEDKQNLNDTLVINLKFENGSVASISYFSNGNEALSKEYLEVYGGGTTAILNDFKELIIYGKKKKKFKALRQDKGHREEVKKFLRAVKDGEPSPIPFDQIYISNLLPFKIIESIRSFSTVKL